MKFLYIPFFMATLLMSGCSTKKPTVNEVDNNSSQSKIAALDINEENYDLKKRFLENLEKQINSLKNTKEKKEEDNFLYIYKGLMDE